MMSRTRAAFLIACLALVMAGILSAAPAKADTYGWHWQKHNLTYYDGTHSRYTAAAFKAWDDATNLTFSKATEASADFTVNYGPTLNGWDAQCDWRFDSNGNPVKVLITVNEKYAGNDGRARYFRKVYLTYWVLHEDGHGIGLAHTDPLLTVPSVMYANGRDASVLKAPTTYDVGQAHLLGY
jgi:hypothetical protein